VYSSPNGGHHGPPASGGRVHGRVGQSSRHHEDSVLCEPSIGKARNRKGSSYKALPVESFRTRHGSRSPPGWVLTARPRTIPL
jgi:hypothetical protein